MKPGKNLIMTAGPALLVFFLFMFSSSVKPYGFFIDELYFMACAKRLAFGYIDQPPLSIVLLRMMQDLFGNNMYAIRFLPAASISATVFLTGRIARQMGGGLPGMMLASLGVMVMPVFLLFGSFYSMNAYEPLIWTAIVLFVIKMVQEQKPVYWIQVGILLGLGLEMKHTIILYAVALLTGFLISDQRKLLFNRWILLGGAACFAIILPNLVWQFVNHFPSLELYRNSFTTKNIDKTWLQVLADQVVFVNPFTFPLWITGLVALGFPKGRKYRLMLYTYGFLLLVLLAGHSSRPDRIASIYPFFMASGAVAVEQYLKGFLQRFVQVSLGVVMIAGGMILAPVFLPLLPPPALKTYIARLGLKFDIEEGKKGEPVPQWLADRIGWRDLSAEVARVYHHLPEHERQNAVIISANYGEAGALELYGADFGLPPVYATHNSFHAWGPPPDSVRTFIGVYIDADDVRPRFDSMVMASVYRCPFCTRPQRSVPVYLLRGPKFSMKKEWKNFKNYH